MTVTLTARQAHRLNQLADACAGAYQAAVAVKTRAEHIAEQVSKGHHIEGFTSDVLGQPGREVQHYASQREVLIRAAAGCPQAAIQKALTTTTQHGTWFSEGDEYDDAVPDEPPTTRIYQVRERAVAYGRTPGEVVASGPVHALLFTDARSFIPVRQDDLTPES